MGRLFGTDGVRGVAGKDLNIELAMKIGKGAAYVLTKNKDNVRILICNDGRESADMLVSALVSGLTSIGVDVVDGGILPTPAVSYLVGKRDFDAGIMVTASHNSYEYNGIKIFDCNGFKLADDLENEIEEYVFNDVKKDSDRIGRLYRDTSMLNEYVEHLVSASENNLSNIHIAIDAACGAASYSAELLFSKLGVKYDIINNTPDGTNINDKCGALHTELLAKYVVDNGLDGGVAFDGDSDRAIFVDENGDIVDGDYVLAILGTELKNNNRLNNNTIVGTIMTNLGFVKFCEKNDINFVATKVGDRYVLEEIINNDFSIGGEQSGHIIIKECANTGDGQLTAVKVFGILAKNNCKFSELASIMKKYPQVMENVRISVNKKNEIYTNLNIKNIIDDVNNKISDRGRIVVRPSGTEPLVRVMLEGEDIEEITMYAKKIAEVVKIELN